MLFITSIFISHCFGTVASQARAYANHTCPLTPKKKAEKDPSAGADQGRGPPLNLGKTGPNKMTPPPPPLAQGWIWITGVYNDEVAQFSQGHVVDHLAHL